MKLQKTKTPRVICPASYFAGLDGGNPHFTTQQEIKNNGGVCAKCRAKFAKRHLKTMARKPSIGVSHFPTHDENVHFNDGNREPCAEFNYDTLDGHGEHESSAVAFASKAITKFALRLYEKGNDTPLLVWAELNALLFAAQLHPNQDKGLKWIAENKGLRRHRLKQPEGSPVSNFSLKVEFWRDLFGMPLGGGCKRHRENSAKAATESHAERGHKMKGITSLAKGHASLDNSIRWFNKSHDTIKCLNIPHRSELIDRLKPLSDLREQLIKQNEAALQDENQEKLEIV